MSFHGISKFILIESPAHESDSEFCAAVEHILREIHPEQERWWRPFSAGQRFTKDGMQFREFACLAGSVAAQIALRANRGGGIARAIIIRADEDEGLRTYEIRDGLQSEFSADELRTV